MANMPIFLTLLNIKQSKVDGQPLIFNIVFWAMYIMNDS